ncbi:hypothetical protein FOCC_FOCC012398 [Frankliniella occidentalis]|uniref:RNA-directed DNA polymerase n=1 Tax=Frankliniella occidentalis TaxID=133901 RepID=A0A6J1S0K6_FRAOC|nr:uncharacterized protein K02A2.6-like [Frankliniella occidentalis]KAE8742071.1 hypothetical protein FOCC_FOCC012398 [Frankliniella occidentalis]
MSYNKLKFVTDKLYCFRSLTRLLQLKLLTALSQDFSLLPDNEVLITQVHSVINKVVYNCRDIYLQHTKADATVTKVIQFLHEGWPKNCKGLDSDLKCYFHLRSELFHEDGLLYFKNRLVISSLKNQLLQELHSVHQGVVKCEALARQSVFWPGINKDIQSFVSDCCISSEFAPALRKPPMLPHEIPSLPYEQVATDILDYYGDYYLVVIDTYSKWIHAIKMPNKTAESVIEVLTFLFSIHGIPLVVLADNPFKFYKCASFAKELNFAFVSCSPHYHQSNGLAEKTVSIVKQFLRKCSKDPKATLANCLLQYRVTPISGLDASPAQLLMSRQLRTTLPIVTSRLKPSLVPNVVSKLNQKAQTAKNFYDKTAQAKEKEFSPSDYVFVKNPRTTKWEPGIVIDVCEEPRSYLVKTNSSNNVIRRNCVFLKPRNVNVPSSTPVTCYLQKNQNNVPIPEPQVQNNDLDNNQIVIPLQEVNQNLDRWREQLRERLAQNQQGPQIPNVPRTRTRVVKQPQGLNL